MDFVRIVGWLLVVVLLYAAVQGFIGLREYKARIRQEREAGGATFGGRTASEMVMRGGVGYYAVMAVELGLVAVAIWALTRA